MNNLLPCSVIVLGMAENGEQRPEPGVRITPRQTLIDKVFARWPWRVPKLTTTATTPFPPSSMPICVVRSIFDCVLSRLRQASTSARASAQLVQEAESFPAPGNYWFAV
ncbi:hypothetical protein ABZW49_43225 [Nonomuraea wenchangensis]